jgi:hypothetical protein
MIIPAREGGVPNSSQFIFAAGDAIYFEVHGKPLVNSVLQNTKYDIHIHVYNPSNEHINWLSNKDRVTFSYERISPLAFESIADDWMIRQHFNNHREKQMFDKGMLHGRSKLVEIITQTYYACCRFIRLNEILANGSRCLSIDIDGIVRTDFPIKFGIEHHDLYLYKKKSNEHLAGAILFTERAKPFLNEYANNICHYMEIDDIYWFLDQIELDKCIPKYNSGILPMSYIDWEMDVNSAIWSAKGKRKETIVFLDEQKKYNF